MMFQNTFNPLSIFLPYISGLCCFYISPPLADLCLSVVHLLSYAVVVNLNAKCAG